MIARIALALVFLVIAYRAVAAEDCTLKRVAWLDAELMPDGEFVIPALIAGRPARLALDPTSYTSVLSRAFVEAAGMKPKTDLRGLGLPMWHSRGMGPRPFAGFGQSVMGLVLREFGHELLHAIGMGGMPFTVFGQFVTGRPMQEYVAADSVEVGALKLDEEYEFWITDQTLTFDGTLGLANKSFSAYDVEIDFPRRKVGFYSQNHCPEQVVSWSDKYDVLSFLDRDEYRTFHVTLDGKRLDAVMTTEFPGSIIDKDAARRSFGIVPGNDLLNESSPLTLPSGRVVRAYATQFKQLTLGAVTLSNVPMLVADISGPDLILGTRELRALHLYIAYEERKIYVTATSP